MIANTWLIWIIAGILLFIGEIFTPGFLLACFGLACFISGLIAFSHFSFAIQILSFSLSSLLIFFAVRPFFMKFLYASSGSIKTNTDALVGRTGILTEEFDTVSRRGRVVVEGENWSCVPLKGHNIEVGQKVTVIKIEGAKLVVQPLSE